MSFISKFLIRAGVACLVAAPLSSAFAQETAAPDQNFSLELNSAADTTSGSCRLTYVASNQSDIALNRTAYEVAVFDGDGTVTRLLVLEFGELIEGKTKILQFDLADTTCASISRILINDVSACEQSSDGTTIDFCMVGLSASSRTAIQFGI